MNKIIDDSKKISKIQKHNDTAIELTIWKKDNTGISYEERTNHLVYRTQGSLQNIPQIKDKLDSDSMKWFPAEIYLLNNKHNYFVDSIVYYYDERGVSIRKAQIQLIEDTVA